MNPETTEDLQDMNPPPPPPEEAGKPMEPEATSPPMVPAKRRRLPLLRSRRGDHLLWIGAVVLLPFLVLYLWTALPRMWIPFNLEWNEGHSAEQALRFAHGKPLYPKAEDGWVPYMYAPLYHMVFGTVMKLTGSWHLGWGRLISFSFSLLGAAGIAALIMDRTRRWPTAIIGALAYFAYFKPSGYWYDIARLDSMAVALVLWAMYFSLKRNGTTAQLVLGMLLFVAAALTKQTMGAVAIVCGLWMLGARWRSAMPAFAAAAVVSGAFLFFFWLKGDNPQFFQYTVTNAQRHSTSWNVAMPGSVWTGDFLKTVPNPNSKVSVLKTWVEQSRQRPPKLWDELGRHVWIFLGMGMLWIGGALRRRQHPRGWFVIVPVVVLYWGSVAGFAKAGGYMNNFQPAFAGTALLLGFAVDGIWRLFPGRWRVVPAVVIPLLIFAQCYQPWNRPDPKDGPRRWQMIAQEPNSEIREELQRYFRIADGHGTGEISPQVRRRFERRRWIVAGMLWIPSQQMPAPGSAEAHAEFLAWLRQKNEAGEKVWVAHQQWYAFLTGHETTWNIDMVRCVEWAGGGPPGGLSQLVRSQKYQWIVLDMTMLQYEWLPRGMREDLVANYESQGALPFLAERRSDRLLKPVTGAETRPWTVYRAKNFTGSILPREAVPAIQAAD